MQKRRAAMAILSIGSLIGFGSLAGASTVSFPFDTPAGDLGATHTYTSGALSIIASGYALATTPTDLWGKIAGSDEDGLGLASDPTGDHEISGLSFVQLDVRALFGKVASLTAGFGFSSSTDGETWAVYGSNSTGVRGTKLSSGTDEITHTFAGVGGYAYYDFAAVKGNVLLHSVSVDPVAAPEPVSFFLLGVGLFSLAALRHRRI